MTDKIDDQREQLPGGLSKNGPEALLARFRARFDYAARDRRPPPLVAIDYAIRDSPTEALLARAREVGGDAAADRLARETLVHVRRLLETWWTALLLAIVDGEPPFVGTLAAEDLCERESWLPGFVAHLRQLGADGAGMALQIEAMPDALSALREVRDDLPQWIRTLVRVVWEDRVKTEIELRQRLRAPAIVNPFARDLVGMRRAAVVDGAIRDDTGRASPLVPLGPASLAALHGGGAAGVLRIGDARKGLDALDSPTADRLFGWLLRQGFELFTNAELASVLVTMPARLVHGGVSTIAREIGLKGSKAANEVSALLAMLAETRLGWDLPGRRGQPLALLHIEQITRAAPGRPESFVLGFSPLWSPGLCSLLTGSDRVLVPWLPLPSLDGLHTKHVRAAVRMWRRVRLALRTQAAELRAGGIDLQWDHLAAEAELPRERVAAVRALWTKRDDAPLTETRGGLVDVRDPDVRALLLEGIARSERRAADGRRAAAKRKRRDKK